MQQDCQREERERERERAEGQTAPTKMFASSKGRGNRERELHQNRGANRSMWHRNLCSIWKNDLLFTATINRQKTVCNIVLLSI